MKPIALIVPWYGDQIRGGAEMACNYLAHSLTDCGACVEVFTSCVEDAAQDRGKNTIKPGIYKENEIKVRRFLVREDRNLDSYSISNSKIYNNDNFDIEDEKIYFKEDINSPDMYKYIRENKSNYSVFIFIPYMYGIVYNGSSECPEKSILIPCLHDESYAYMELLKTKMPTFKGMIFLSKPEYDLANKLYSLENVKKLILGTGVDTDWKDHCNPQAFREKYNVHSDFILYAGRKDLGKKADELLDFFIKYKKENTDNDLKLVFLGGGTLPNIIPSELEESVLDFGFVSTEDKHNAFSACTIFCNPSHFESFSIVIMESWVAKRPVIVSGNCEVTKNFCLESNGGLYYDNYEEFCCCVEYLLDNRKIADKMGENGQEYVISNFTHKKIANDYLQFINDAMNI